MWPVPSPQPFTPLTPLTLQSAVVVVSLVWPSGKRQWRGGETHVQGTLCTTPHAPPPTLNPVHKERTVRRSQRRCRFFDVAGVADGGSIMQSAVDGCWAVGRGRFCVGDFTAYAKTELAASSAVAETYWCWGNCRYVQLQVTRLLCSKATSPLCHLSELRSCVEVEVDVLGSRP